MLDQMFRNASEGFGIYCPDKNELRIRKRKRLYRFTCCKSELQFSAPGQNDVVIYLASDATTDELKRCFTYLIDSH